MTNWDPDPGFYRPTLRVANLEARGGLRRGHLNAVMDARERQARGFDHAAVVPPEPLSLRRWVGSFLREHWGLVLLAVVGATWVLGFCARGLVVVPR